MTTCHSLVREGLADFIPEVKECILAKLNAGQDTVRGSAVGAVVQKLAEERLGGKVDIRGLGGIVEFVAAYLSDILRHVPEDEGTDALFERTSCVPEQETLASKSEHGAPSMTGGLKHVSVAISSSLSRKEFADILPEIRDGILAKLKLGQASMRGSAVGAVIQKLAEEQLGCRINIRASGGIVGFVARYLSDVLRHVPDDDGSDPLFEDASLFENTRHACRSDSAFSHNPDFWRAFTNPNTDIFLAVESNFRNLAVGPQQSSNDDDLIPLNKITAPTQYSWAREFAESVIPIEQRATAISLLEARNPEDFSGKWISFLKSGTLLGYSSRWEKFRVQRATAALREQLQALQCPDEHREKLVRNLADSQAGAKRGVPITRIPATIHDSVAPLNPKASAELLRSLAHYAMDCASIETLRELKIPLGIVVDFLQQRDRSTVRHL